VPAVIRASHTAIAVWAGLMIATLASWWLGIEEGGMPGDGASAATAAVIAVAFIKIRFIGRHFMELRSAPPVLRLSFDAYVATVGIALTVIYIVTS
jgi:apolipoprotein N-acyltransferase